MILFGSSKGTYLAECIRSIKSEHFVFCTRRTHYSLIVKRYEKDEMLKREFGKEWEEWAGKVRNALVPGFI